MDEIIKTDLEPEVEETELEPVVEPEVDQEPETVIGVVCGCKMLNVRETAIKTADIVSLLPVDTEVLVDKDGSTDGWYKICTAAGIEGFCMKEFIELQQ